MLVSGLWGRKSPIVRSRNKARIGVLVPLLLQQKLGINF